MPNSRMLLTLDAGSVLYNPRQMPDEVVLKHQDGELIKIEYSTDEGWICTRREEFGVNFTMREKYRSTLEAIAVLADSQAFGIRVNGLAVNPFAVIDAVEVPETIEIECLKAGGVMIESDRQLPFAIYTPTEVYYRVYTREVSDTEDPYRGKSAVLEKRTGIGGDWHMLDWAPPTEMGGLLEIIADETGMNAVSGDSSELDEVFEEYDGFYLAGQSPEDDEVREEYRIQNGTVFSPELPKPRPVEFPASE